MRIGLNATCFSDRPSGARQRFLGIYGEVVKRLPDVEFVVYEPSDARVGKWFGEAPNVKAVRTPVPSEGRLAKVIHGSRFWRPTLAAAKLDILEQFNLPSVNASGARTLLTIHDIRALHGRTHSFKRAAVKSIIGRSLRAADHVVTVSESMKADILDVFPDVPVSVIYNGVNLGACDHLSDLELEGVRRRYSLPREFILAVGHIEARKNYATLIDALAQLHSSGRSCPLVIVGNDGGGRSALLERIQATGQTANVMLLSNLTDVDVRCAYKLCSLFVFPSAYEGFGIPILEAMDAGRAMVLSDIPVFREITENQGVYCECDNSEAMASAIGQLLESSGDRGRLIAYGHERVQAFGFPALAAQIECLYGELL